LRKKRRWQAPWRSENVRKDVLSRKSPRLYPRKDKGEWRGEGEEQPNFRYQPLYKPDVAEEGKRPGSEEMRSVRGNSQNQKFLGNATFWKKGRKDR